MAAVEVTISGVLYDKYSRTTRPVVLIGEASLTGVGVGGGPMPPGQGGDAHPEHPIYYPPHIWGPPDMPPGFWGGGMGPGVKPQPPDMPTEPPSNPTEPKPPPDEGGWGWHPTYGWGYFPMTGGKPNPAATQQPQTTTKR